MSLGTDDGSCITIGCSRLVTYSSAPWCQTCDLSLSLEAEYGTRILLEWLDGEHQRIPAQKDAIYPASLGISGSAPLVYDQENDRWVFLDRPEDADDWEYPAAPYYLDDDEAMS